MKELALTNIHFPSPFISLKQTPNSHLHALKSSISHLNPTNTTFHNPQQKENKANSISSPSNDL